MFRFDGEVFLLGTAIPAPSTRVTSIKMATICASSRRGFPHGGSWIVANRGSYSETPRKRKSDRRKGVIADTGIGLALVPESRHRPVTGNEGRLVAHRPQLRQNRADELLLVAARKVPAADRTFEKNVADERQAGGWMMEDDVPGRVTGTMANIQAELADHHLFAVLEPA